uniref:Uncharacterized protein n=1 Tax=Oryza barthii TaxID=65489 RepID=A0A0D3EXJ5_9ORYZ
MAAAAEEESGSPDREQEATCRRAASASSASTNHEAVLMDGSASSSHAREAAREPQIASRRAVHIPPNPTPIRHNHGAPCPRHHPIKARPLQPRPRAVRPLRRARARARG